MTNDLKCMEIFLKDQIFKFDEITIEMKKVLKSIDFEIHVAQSRNPNSTSLKMLGNRYRKNETYYMDLLRHQDEQIRKTIAKIEYYKQTEGLCFDEAIKAEHTRSIMERTQNGRRLKHISLDAGELHDFTCKTGQCDTALFNIDKKEVAHSLPLFKPFKVEGTPLYIIPDEYCIEIYEDSDPLFESSAWVYHEDVYVATGNADWCDPTAHVERNIISNIESQIKHFDGITDYLEGGKAFNKGDNVRFDFKSEFYPSSIPAYFEVGDYKFKVVELFVGANRALKTYELKLKVVEVKQNDEHQGAPRNEEDYATWLYENQC